jgi:hypothetical protein
MECPVGAGDKVRCNGCDGITVRPGDTSDPKYRNERVVRPYVKFTKTAELYLDQGVSACVEIESATLLTPNGSGMS